MCDKPLAQGQAQCKHLTTVGSLSRKEGRQVAEEGQGKYNSNH